MCSLYHPKSGRILNARVKLLTDRAGMSRHTTMRAESWLVFIDDSLLNNCSIWHGKADRTRQVC
jgi:hypothetical protein